MRLPLLRAGAGVRLLRTTLSYHAELLLSAKRAEWSYMSTRLPSEARHAIQIRGYVRRYTSRSRRVRAVVRLLRGVWSALRAFLLFSSTFCPLEPIQLQQLYLLPSGADRSPSSLALAQALMLETRANS